MLFRNRDMQTFYKSQEFRLSGRVSDVYDPNDHPIQPHSQFSGFA